MFSSNRNNSMSLPLGRGNRGGKSAQEEKEPTTEVCIGAPEHETPYTRRESQETREQEEGGTQGGTDGGTEG